MMADGRIASVQYHVINDKAWAGLFGSGGKGSFLQEVTLGWFPVAGRSEQRRCEVVGRMGNQCKGLRSMERS